MFGLRQWRWLLIFAGGLALWFPLGLFERAAPLADAFTAAPQLSLPMTTTLAAKLYLPLVHGQPLPKVVIAAAHIDSALSGELDEALLLWQLSGPAQSLAGWRIAASTRQASFPLTSTLTLMPGQRLWCTATATAFRTTFGEEPACEWASDSDPHIENLTGKLILGNAGGQIQLFNAQGQLLDTLLYGDEEQPATGWQGLPAQLYTRGVLPAVGQVWQRKRDPTTNLWLDTDQTSDWAGDLADLTWGRQVRLPGWQGWGQADLGWPVSGVATATVTLLIGPEGLYQPLAELFGRATLSIDLSIYTLEHRELTQSIADAVRRGVKVRLLLEGSPPGGISDFQKWCVQQIVVAGGEVRYAAPLADAPKGYRTRYRYTHAKYGLIDNWLALNGSENFGYDSMPITPTLPLGGRRGYYLITDASPVVAGLRQIFAADWAPDRFFDLRPYVADDPKYGGPPADFMFEALPAYAVAEAPFRSATTVTGSGRFSVISAPENALRADAGLFALIQRAGAGDEILLEQLYENKHWGDSTSNPIADPNPRLEALIAAARRGAKVRLLLDSFFDDPQALRSNRATVEYVRAVAAAGTLDLEARLGNPTLGGIHAKIVLLRLGGETWTAIGSLNGGEVSHKLNREVMTLTDLALIHTRATEVFFWDWAHSSTE
jgi:phosphatidylserine/phosphatidylglycerophosphate/cardiolipin synthase-like enzyme